MMRLPDVQSNILLRNGHFACPTHTFVCLHVILVHMHGEGCLTDAALSP